MIRRIVKASEEGEDFYNLIGTEVTFACEIITIGGSISHFKGEKAIIRDVSYVKGWWSNICSNLYYPPEISTIHLKGIERTCWIKDTFVEFRQKNK